MADALRTYDRIAPIYDLMDGPYEVLWKRKLRSDVFRGLSGRILDAGAGTGCNIVAYPRGADILAVDGSAAMLARARMRARNLRAGRAGRDITFAQMDLTALDLPDASFDAVVATFVFMCIPQENVLGALRGLARVCKPDGEIRLVDYCMSQRPLVRFGMKVMSPWLKFTFAGSYEPPTEDFYTAAGLVPVETKLLFGDVVKLVRLKRI